MLGGASEELLAVAIAQKLVDAFLLCRRDFQAAADSNAMRCSAGERKDRLRRFVRGAIGKLEAQAIAR